MAIPSPGSWQARTARDDSQRRRCFTFLLAVLREGGLPTGLARRSLRGSRCGLGRARARTRDLAGETDVLEVRTARVADCGPSFVVISHERRRIEHWNVTAHPRAAWVWRQVIAATAWSRTPRFWIRDRDTSYGGDFVPKAAGIGIRTVLTPVRAPQANSIAERVIGTLRRECCDHVIVRNERHLRRVLREYIHYYNEDRPHQSLALQPPDGPAPAGSGPIISEPVLGGLHHVYRRAA